MLLNGSFEQGTFLQNTGDHNNELLYPGATDITGWTVVGVGSLAWTGTGNPYNQTASDGSFALDLTGFTDTRGKYTGVTQTVATTIGGHYTLTFDLGSQLRYGVPVGITATAGAVSQDFQSSATAGNTNVWTPESLSFVATGMTTKITLQGSAGYQYVGLDNVGLTLAGVSVPEPGSVALLASTLIGLGLLRRRSVAQDRRQPQNGGRHRRVPPPFAIARPRRAISPRSPARGAAAGP